jgi:hypothetical protein
MAGRVLALPIKIFNRTIGFGFLFLDTETATAFSCRRFLLSFLQIIWA